MPAPQQTIVAAAAHAAAHAGRAGEDVSGVSSKHRGIHGPLQVPVRTLMGPGPSNAHPRVLAAQTLPLLGHMHPAFFKIMDEIQGGLRYLFQTDTPYTCLISGTGHAGMEAVIANLLEPGDKVVVGVNGIWGERVSDMAERFRADVIQLRCSPGHSFSIPELKAAVEEHRPAMLFLVQGESSTGVHQALGGGLGAACRAAGTLLAVDTVASLGGVPFLADEWGVDASYSGSQKVLGAPPGAAPLMLGERALAKLRGRSTKPATYNLDLNLIGDYWGWFGKRSYHHTAMVSMCFAMREALAIVGDEGLQEMARRHAKAHADLWEGLRSLGLEPFAEDPEDRLVTVNTIKVPPGIDWAALNAFAMGRFSVEIAGGLGPSAGKVWRVGLMGANAAPAQVRLVLAAFKEGLAAQGWAPAGGVRGGGVTAV